MTDDVRSADEISRLFENNHDWAARMEAQQPGFFAALANQQAPRFLWIGCSDSRVPANQLTGLMPGEVFVHRNVANVVLETDINCMSVVDFAIRILEVRHVIVCGHYGCSGVKFAMTGEATGVAEHWISGIRDLYRRHDETLSALDDASRHAHLCELNVREQVRALCRTGIVRDAWRRGQALDVHGWIYGVADGLLRDLGTRVCDEADLANI